MLKVESVEHVVLQPDKKFIFSRFEKLLKSVRTPTSTPKQVGLIVQSRFCKMKNLVIFFCPPTYFAC